MNMRLPATGAWHDDRGVAAVEFAMVAPAFIMLAVGTFYLCMCLFLTGSLHYAVEQAARCASIQTTVCDTSHPTSITDHAQSNYFGPGGTPSFTYTAAACGNRVSATMNYVWSIGLKQFTLPVSATACFP
jgi:Flp pilus assembly protein TadG